MIKYEYDNNDYLLNNVYNWGKIYKGAGKRFIHIYSNYFKDGICVKCNKKVEYYGRFCNNCRNEYDNIKNIYRTKAIKLLKNKSDDKFCEITGCDKKTLKQYIEQFFDEDINWENQNSYWQVDHIIPVSWFDFLFS